MLRFNFSLLGGALLGGVLLLGCRTAGAPTARAAAAAPPDTAAVAVVELFTSEGCSSCRAVRAALAEPAPVGVPLAVDTATAPLRVGYRLDGPAPEDADLRLAVVERGLSQSVERGENAGRTLRHANVVRTFATVDAADGTTTLALPDAVDRADASVMAYVPPPRAPSSAPPGWT